jgi:hypothetical protein
VARLRCLCGNEISNNLSPSPNNGWLVNDHDWTIYDSVDDIIVRDVWECHECGRIAFGNFHDSGVKWYEPSNKEPGFMTRPEFFKLS